jgi:WD40 repeat protein
MTVSLKHTFQSAKADSADTTIVQPSNWNEEHELTLATNKVLGRATAGTGAAEELSIGAALSISGGTLAVTTVPAANGGTGLTSPGTSGNVLTSNGTGWTSSALPVSAVAYPQNIQSANYTLLIGDAGKQIFHPASDTAARTYTIPANSVVAFPIGTVVLFTVENGAPPVTVAITTDTLIGGNGTTGSIGVPANNTLMAIKVTATKWMANYLYQAEVPRYQVAMATGTSPFVLAYPWNSGTGFGVQYASPTTLPNVTSYGVAFSPLANAVAVASFGSPYIDAYGWGAAGFGTKFSNPATLPTGTGNGVAFSPAANALAVAHNTSPYVTVYPWTASGFGTKYANPATLPIFTGNDVAFSPDGNSIAVGHDNSPFIAAYPWNSTTGFGTKFTNPATLPPSAVKRVAFSPAGDALAVAHSSSPYATVYPWNSSTGFGTKFANPATAIVANTGYSVAFNPAGNAIVVGLDFNVQGTTAYAWSGAGWGARLANYTIPPSNPFDVYDIAFSPDGAAVSVVGWDSVGAPLAKAVRWTSTGFGAAYPLITTPTSSLYAGVAFNSSF